MYISLYFNYFNLCMRPVLHSYTPSLKVCQNRFGKFERINILSDRKLSAPYPVHLLLLLQWQWHSTPSSYPSHFFSLPLKLLLLPWLYWVVLPAPQETLSPLGAFRFLIKGGSQCWRCSANWLAGGKKKHFTGFKVCLVKPKCHLAFVSSVPSSAPLLFHSVGWTESFVV